jgi:hypothetical protein
MSVHLRFERQSPQPDHSHTEALVSATDLISLSAPTLAFHFTAPSMSTKNPRIPFIETAKTRDQKVKFGT